MVDKPVSLGCLCAEVDNVAAEEQVVFGRDRHRVAHEDTAVPNKGHGHGTRDTVAVSVSFRALVR